MSSAPLREVAPRATLHRPSLSRAQIQVRAISEQPFMAGFDFFFSLPLDSLAFFALMHTVRTHFDLTAPLESAEVSSSLCVAFPCVVFLV